MVTTRLMPTGTPGIPVSFSAKSAGTAAIPAVIYDGVGDYLLHTGGPASASDGTTGTFVWSGTFNSDGSAMTLFDIPGTVPVLLERQSDNTIDFEVGTSGAVCSASTTAVAASLGFLIVLASFTGTTARLYVIHAAGTITGTPSAGSGASADLTADWYLGSDGGAANFLDADTAMWWADDGYIDFSDSDNREEFWNTTSDLLRDPGSDGSNPSGAQPLVCHVNPSASHDTNIGSGGDADGGSNSGDGTSPGQYADDYSASATIAFTDSAEDESDVSEYTFSGMDIGDAASDRYVVAGIHGRDTGSNTISGVTIGGETASAVVFHENTTGTAKSQVALYIAAVPTGTAADVVVTFAGAGIRCGCSVFRVTGIDSATASATDTGQAGADISNPSNDTMNMTIAAGGVAIAIGSVSKNVNCTFTGITERYDEIFATSTFYSYGGGSDLYPSGGSTDITIEWPSTGTEPCPMVCATWDPA